MYIHRTFVVHRENSPCMDCEERQIGCHSNCERYQEYASKLRKTKLENTQRYKGQRMAEDYTQELYAKLKRRGKIRRHSK